MGILTAEVNPANIKKLIRFLSNRLGNKQMKMSLKKPSGEELTIEVSSQEEFEYVFGKAQKFLNGE